MSTRMETDDVIRTFSSSEKMSNFDSISKDLGDFRFRVHRLSNGWWQVNGRQCSHKYKYTSRSN